MQARRVGEQAVLVQCADAAEVAGAYALLRERRAELGAVEVVPAARTVLLDGLRDAGAVVALLAGWDASRQVTEAVAGEAEVVLDVVYDGADLAEVAAQWRVAAAEVVRVHTSTVFTVAFCGFAPGFAYCTGLQGLPPVRRRESPRARVPAGAVALAGEYTGVYPTASPGGWQLIGHTDAELWRADRERPALLAPGTQVRFRAG